MTPPPRRARRTRAGLAFIIAVPLLMVAACQELGNVQVLSLTFKGNVALTTQDLMAVLATRPSGWLPWSARHYFSKTEFAADLNRIEQTYADRGYAKAKVKDVQVDFNGAKDGVHISLTIDEGAPTLIEQIVFTGFEPLPPAGQTALKTTTLKAGQPRDRRAVIATRELAQRAFHDEGYPFATVEQTETPGSAPQHVIITFTATPGPQSHFGPVTIVGNTNVRPGVIHRTLTFLPGQLYSERKIVESQRRLQGLPVFDLANIDAHSGTPDQADHVPVTITVKEALAHRATLRVGYGSEDKARVSADWTDLNVFGGAETVTVAGKWSSLNRAAQVSFGYPSFIKRTRMDVTADVGTSDEPAFTSRNSGGRLTFTRDLGSRSDKPGSVTANLKLVYTHEFLSYQIKSDSLATPAFREPLIALGLDPETGKGDGTVGALAFEANRQVTDVQVDPTRGYAATGRFEYATPSLGGTFRYREYSMEVRKYTPLGTRARIASRLRFGTIAAIDDTDVPFSGRYFLGGSMNLRGWGRFEVSPLSANGETVGGRTRFDLTNEYRVDHSDHLTEVFFLDTGNVWAGDFSMHLNQLRYDAGAGLRYKTAVGALRVDVGYQLNPIAGLVVNGAPSTRRWRIHFGIGEAF